MKRQQTIEQHSARKKTIRDKLSSDILPVADKLRLEGQLEIVSEQISATVAEIIDADTQTDTLEEYVKESQRRMKALSSIPAHIKAAGDAHASVSLCIRTTTDSTLRNCLSNWL